MVDAETFILHHRSFADPDHVKWALRVRTVDERLTESKAGRMLL